ncbi:MAG: hypothetical protein HKN33_01245 [Pyrinomonadaceae bacterium]|nr:hypothetical protein [Pyrinomonadaceae bacterium]
MKILKGLHELFHFQFNDWELANAVLELDEDEDTERFTEDTNSAGSDFWHEALKNACSPNQENRNNNSQSGLARPIPSVSGGGDQTDYRSFYVGEAEAAHNERIHPEPKL